jgi:protein-S-isoprenylcysteine O-methyltransferase Ste14
MSAGPLLPLQGLALAAVLLAWVGLGIALFARSRGRGRSTRRRDVSSLFGMALQGVGFALVFGIQERWTRVRWPELLRAGASILLSAGAVLLVGWALRVLGKQWSLAARLLEDHRLITGGPYAWVRHPIYVGFLVLLLASGAAVSSLAVIGGATALYVAGTLVRTSREDRLLRASFGNEYESYARRVPALVPRIAGGRRRPHGRDRDG